jgi:hypothetical protein
MAVSSFVGFVWWVVVTGCEWIGVGMAVFSVALVSVDAW